MTSNHPERLDAALVRPGRIDVKLELGYADDGQVAEMFMRFFPERGLAGAREYVRVVRSSGAADVAMAEVQRYAFQVSVEELALTFVQVLLKNSCRHFC